MSGEDILGVLNGPVKVPEILIVFLDDGIPKNLHGSVMTWFGLRSSDDRNSL